MDQVINSMESIGIIAATPQERQACLRFIEQSKHCALGPFHCQRFQLLDRDCWLLTSGMGLKRAAQAACTLIEAIRPQLLISVGVAGAVNTTLEIGDVVASRDTCYLNKGLPGPLKPLAHLSEAAWQAAAQALQPRRARLVSGTAVSTQGSQNIQPQPEQMTNPVLEMETWGIAQVTAEQAISLLSLRAISDGPRAPIPFNLEEMIDEQDNLRMGEIVKMILGQPRLLLQLLRMGRNTTKAAENAAIALIAALRQPEPLITP